jgi:hypothetical protein
MQNRTAQLLQEFQSGDPSALDAMKKAGQCMSTCQNEFISCVQRWQDDAVSVDALN